MTDVSRYDGHDGGAGRPKPQVPAALARLLDQLAGPYDFWDRPDGYFGPLTDSYRLCGEERAHANSLYRLGSKALVKGELLRAAQWLGPAAEAGHPGALFRLAVLALRSDWDRHDDVRFFIAEAARHGHGDARSLLAATAHRRPFPDDPPAQIQDTLFFDEVRQGLDVSLEMLTPEDVEGVTAGGGVRLVLVPPPALPAAARPAPTRTEAPTVQRPARLRALDDDETDRTVPLILPLSSPAPYLAAATAGAEAAARSDTLPADTARDGRGGREPWWSANALRPAVLTDMTRTKTLPAQAPAQQAAAYRALELVLHIQAAGGITTRDLARRTGISMADTSWLLHWLRAQFFIKTVSGAHFAGPVLEMAARTDHHEQLMQQVLDGLRDQIGAAVYLAKYTDGEIDVLQSSHSTTAPPVRLKAPFPQAGHASAVGKALLADLDFAARMEHLARYAPVPLTERTITSPRLLFDALDRHGPNAAQFDVLEYSHLNVCAGFSLTLPGHDATCVALALPAHRRHDLIRAATALSHASTGLLLTRLLTTPHPTPSPLTPPAALLPHRAIALP